MSPTSPDIFVGVDSGTQSTKVLLVDGDTGRILASGSAPHDLITGLPPGHLEQHPHEWWSAFETAFRQALSGGQADPTAIRAIGVSGQQHGFVPLDESGEVIRPAKLWCDTATTPQCERILERLGGLSRCVELTGNGMPPGFTAPKILWLQESEPHSYARLRTVLLPHDYLNYRLTGRCCMEYGDASGTALLNVRRRSWSPEVIAAIDPDLAAKLPPLIADDQPVGTIQAAVASRFGLPADVLVSAGGGDNMMSAIGTGNVTEGVITVSLGTSGTIFAYSPSPLIDPRGEIAAFCDSTGAWLPLVCTMNVTVATELTRELFGLAVADLDRVAAQAPPGSDGLVLVPYFDGERTPNVPDGAGVWFGANRRTHTRSHFCRAAMEGATLGLNYGLTRLRELGLTGREIRLAGGGANSVLWRQIAADVFNMPVVCLRSGESAALGAALQAKWCWKLRRDPSASLARIADTWIEPIEETRTVPDPARHALYQDLAALQTNLSSALRDSFTTHRRLLTHHPG